MSYDAGGGDLIASLRGALKIYRPHGGRSLVVATLNTVIEDVHTFAYADECVYMCGCR